MRILLWVFVITTGAGQFGCNSFQHRAGERAEVFASLDPATQSRLKSRDLRLGDTEDMVYIALGVPDAKRDELSAEGSRSIWIYNAYWQEYQGQELVGFRRQVVQDKETGRYRVYYEPTRVSVLVPREEERIRVTFRNGHVTAIEQAQR